MNPADLAHGLRQGRPDGRRADHRGRDGHRRDERAWARERRRDGSRHDRRPTSSSTPPGCGRAKLGERSGVSVPLQAAEHYYLITDTVDWAHPDLPVVEDPDRYGYYREEGAGSSSACSSRSPGRGRSTASRPISPSPACRRSGIASGRTCRRRWTASRRSMTRASARCSAGRRASRPTTRRTWVQRPSSRATSSPPA